MRIKALVLVGVVAACLAPASAAQADPYGPLAKCYGLFGKPVAGVSVDPQHVRDCRDILVNGYIAPAQTNYRVCSESSFQAFVARVTSSPGAADPARFTSEQIVCAVQFLDSLA